MFAPDSCSRSSQMNVQPLEAVKDLFELPQVVSIGEVHANDCIHRPVTGGGFEWTSLAASTCRWLVHLHPMANAYWSTPEVSFLVSSYSFTIFDPYFLLVGDLLLLQPPLSKPRISQNKQPPMAFALLDISIVHERVATSASTHRCLPKEHSSSHRAHIQIATLLSQTLSRRKLSSAHRTSTLSRVLVVAYSLD